MFRESGRAAKDLMKMNKDSIMRYETRMVSRWICWIAEYWDY